MPGQALEVVDQKVERPHLPLLRRPVLGRLPRRQIQTEGRGDEGGRPARVGRSIHGRRRSWNAERSNGRLADS